MAQLPLEGPYTHLLRQQVAIANTLIHLLGKEVIIASGKELPNGAQQLHTHASAVA